MKAGYAATFASEASMAIRANLVRGAVNPIPRHTRVAGSPAGIIPSVLRYKIPSRRKTGDGLTVPERAVGDRHSRQTVWLRADGPRACGSPPPYDLAGDSRVPVVLHGFEGIRMEGSRQDRAASHSRPCEHGCSRYGTDNPGTEAGGTDSCVAAATRLTQRPLRPADVRPRGSDVEMKGVPGFETFCERTVACDARGCRMTNIAPWSHSLLTIWTRIWKYVSTSSSATGRRRIEDCNRSG